MIVAEKRNLRHHWTSAPRGLRRAGVLAVITALLGAALLYQTDVRAKRPPVFNRGGPFSEGNQPVLGSTGVNSASAGVGGSSPAPLSARSKATLSVPGGGPNIAQPGSVGPTLPTQGIYTYKVAGYEETNIPTTRRDYPPTMTTKVFRPSGQHLKPDEMVFDLLFSKDHEEREIVQYTTQGAAFTFEGGSITFGPGFSQSDDATYRPPMLQVPFPLDFNVSRSGMTDAIDSKGMTSRTEDWKVQVLGRDTLHLLGQDVDTWVVKIHRTARPGGSEQVDRTRQYWFDPQRMIWVKWTENFTGTKSGFSYHTELTATLQGMEPLS